MSSGSIIDLATRRLPAKPRIKWDAEKKQYVCHDNNYIYGVGVTAYAAWADWKIKEQRRTRVPRRGRWNRQSCMRWFREGCYLIRSYLFEDARYQQIFAYDPTTDELILRG